MELKSKKPQVVARMTMTHPQHKIIVEVREDCDFHTFYRWYRQEGRKRKKFLRTSNRNDGVRNHWRAPFVPLGLDVLAKRTQEFQKDVTGVTIRILRKRKYGALLNCPADRLGAGLPRASQTDAIIKQARCIPVQMPAGYLTLQERMNILTGVRR